jgi:hypothetical protein
MLAAIDVCTSGLLAMAAALSEEPSDETIPKENEISVSGIGFATGEAEGERLGLADLDVVGERDVVGEPVSDTVGLAVMDVEVVTVAVGVTEVVAVTDGDGLAVAEGDGVGDGDGEGPSCGCTALAPAAVTLLR